MAQHINSPHKTQQSSRHECDPECGVWGSLSHASTFTLPLRALLPSLFLIMQCKRCLNPLPCHCTGLRTPAKFETPFHPTPAPLPPCPKLHAVTPHSRLLPPPLAHQACLHRLLANESDLEHARDLQKQQQQCKQTQYGFGWTEPSGTQEVSGTARDVEGQNVCQRPWKGLTVAIYQTHKPHSVDHTLRKHHVTGRCVAQLQHTQVGRTFMQLLLCWLCVRCCDIPAA
jgi:hypothetical protein